MQARASPNKVSDMASTTRAFPEPVGPRNSRLPTGRPGGFNPAKNIWSISTTFSSAPSWPTIFRRKVLSKSRASLLRRVGSRTVLKAFFIGSVALLFLRLSAWMWRVTFLFREATNFVTPRAVCRYPHLPQPFLVQMTRHPKRTAHGLFLHNLDAADRRWSHLRDVGKSCKGK